MQQPLTGLARRAGVELWRVWLADPDTLARFTAKVYRRGPNKCWFWLGALGTSGHGHFRAGSRQTATSAVISAHTFAYQHTHGPIAPRWSEDVVISHRCDEPSCQNPTHLQLGTRVGNLDEYRTRRYRVGWPLADVRGPAGRAAALRAAILTTGPQGPAAVESAIAAAASAGDPYAHQPPLFDASTSDRAVNT